MRKLLNEGPQDLLSQTEFSQPAIFATSYLAYLTYKGNTPQYLIGHSVGEYTALTVAGWLDPLETIKVLRVRGQMMQKACANRKCGMLVVMESEKLALAVLEKIKCDEKFKEMKCELGVYNSGKNNVFTGDLELLAAFSVSLKQKKITNLFLKVSAAFHCSLLQSILGPFEEILRNLKIKIKDPKIPVIRNLDLKTYENKEDIIEGLVKQLNHPVMFYQSVKKIVEENKIKEIIEFASHKSQARTIHDILKEIGAENIKLISV